MTSPRTWSTAGWHDRREWRTRGQDDEIDAGIADYEEGTMHDSGEHDTLDDQIAYEAEHGTREYRLAQEGHQSLKEVITRWGLEDDAWVLKRIGIADARLIQLKESLAPRPPITPTGSIDDVPFTEGIR